MNKALAYEVSVGSLNDLGGSFVEEVPEIHAWLAGIILLQGHAHHEVLACRSSRGQQHPLEVYNKVGQRGALLIQQM